MADTSASPTVISGPPPQAKSVSATIFWIVVVVVVVVIGAVYFLAKKDLDETRETIKVQMRSAADEQEKKTEAAVNEAKKVLNQEIAKQKEVITKLEEASKTTVADLTKLRGDHDAFVKTDADVKKKTETDIAGANSEIVKTNTNVNKIETQVKYLTDDVKKINDKLAAIDSTIKGLGEGSAALKAELQKEHAALVAELATVAKKSGSNEEELRKLENKTLEFQVRVLNERARLAAIEAQKNNNKAVLDLLDLKP